MKKGLTKIVFVVDRSGSMQSVATDMIGGFNQFIKKQKENDVGECRVSFNQFDDIFEKSNDITIHSPLSITNLALSISDILLINFELLPCKTTTSCPLSL